MSDRPASIIVLGKTRLTPDEDDALQTFGYCLHLMEQELVAMPAKGAVMSVITGYLEAGGVPTNLDKGQLPHNDVVVFIDAPLQKALDTRMPDWVNRNWVVVPADRIDDFASMYLALVDQLGIDLTA